MVRRAGFREREPCYGTYFKRADCYTSRARRIKTKPFRKQEGFILFIAKQNILLLPKLYYTHETGKAEFVLGRRQNPRQAFATVFY